MELLSLLAFSFSIAALFFTYGIPMIKDRFKETSYPEGVITDKEVYHYFKEQGCAVWHISPQNNTNNWSAFVIKDGKFYTVVVYTDGHTILDHTLTSA